MDEEGGGRPGLDPGGHPGEHVTVHGVGAGGIALQAGRRVRRRRRSVFEAANVGFGALRVRELELVEAVRPARLVEGPGDVVLVPELRVVGLADGDPVPEQLDPTRHELVDLLGGHEMSEFE